MGTVTRVAHRMGRRWAREDDLPLVRGKFDRILTLAKAKDVLDVGCIGGDRGVDVALTAHAAIVGRARSCVGLDLNEEEIARWQRLGYDVVLGDAEAFDLGKTFDVIVAADLIEHLSNPGGFLECVKRHLREDGVLCLVTPNAFSLNSAFKTLLGMRVNINPEHTCWHDRNTLRQLLARHGFEIVEEYWQDYQAHSIAAFFIRWRKNLAAHIVVVARPLNQEGSE